MKKPAKYQNIHQGLIDECLRGSRKAQFKIYKLYYKAMFNTCMRIVNNPFEAEDIMQESFLKAFSRISEYRQEVSFGAWLKRIVINRSIDVMRSRKVVFEPLDKLKDESIAIETEEDELTSMISAENIIKEIENLSDGYRIVLSLHLIEGYDHKEISEILNIGASTSRSQYSRAKEKLMNNLKMKYLK